MTDHVPINPCTIPQFTGDLDALEQDHAAITAAAGTFRTAGANVDSEFQGLSAFYAAPEAAQLFATTKPVKTDSDFFADQLESAAKALGEYVTEARPIVARLKALQAKATTFTNKIAGDEHWKDDGKKIDENNDLIHDVNAAAEAFWAAERTCANKIRALYCAPPLTVNDGSNGANMYGYKADDLNKVQDLPWGSQLEETHRAWEVGYWVKSFVWDGIIVDGIWGTIRGLGTLVGVDGWDKAGQAWTGLAKLATGLAITTIPGVGTAFWMADDKQLPGWLRDSRTAMKETGKALVAWDEWGKNPARAAGAVTFNVLTTVFTGGAGTAAKAGGIAKVLSVAGKAGKIIDPITYIGKAGSLAKLKIGDLFANLGKVDGAFPKLDDVVWKDLPKADAPGVKFPHPDDTVQLTDDALGRPQYFDKVTNQLLDHKGLPKQDLTSVPKGVDHPLAEVPKRQEVPVGVGAHTADVTSHTPGGATTHTPGGAASHTPGGTADNLPHNSHTEPGGTTPGHGNTDTTPTGGGHTDTPSTGGHGDGPSTGGGGHGDGPGAGGGHGGSGTGGLGDEGIPREEPRPFERGGETERQIRANMRPGKPKPPDLEKALANLADHPAGQEVADLIASGKFNGMTNFEQVVGSFSQKNAMSGGIEQLRLADQLFDSGVRDISFEIKKDVEIKPGVKTGPDTDMDVMARDADGNIYGYQFKEVANPKKVIDKMWQNMGQLSQSAADVKVFVVDTKGSVADMLASGIEKKLARIHSEQGVIVVLRVEDGTLMYPPGASFMPGGRP
ncbi:hypothetical protein [Streptomyces sp. C]|uniref:hypothetical protein n=1 Tax=Streptomyces sp. C TaxID=253839 RepID=UPI0001B536DF|nr:hypothetical protein [Streptomyces sp. C]EFL15902.1 predicted protein [Streptomyces sp. C]